MRAEGDIGMQLGDIAKANPEVAIRSYPFFYPRTDTNVVRHMHRSSGLQNARSRTCWSEYGGEHNRTAA